MHWIKRYLGGVTLGILACVMPQLGWAANDSLDLFSLSIEELSEIKVSVASLLDNNPLHVASNVSVVTESDWQRYGARRTLDAIEHLPSTLVLPVFNGSNLIAIRGYAQATSSRGIATSLDGIRLNNFMFGTAQYTTSDMNLGTLNRIEMIRGPASAIYGSDAFHGVLTLHGFESDRDLNEVSVEGGDHGYYRAYGRHSSEIAAPVRVSVALAGSGESDQQQRYATADDPLAGGLNAIEKEQTYHSESLSLKLASDAGGDLSWRWGLYGDQMDTDDFPYASAAYSSGLDVTNWMTRFAVTKQFSADRSVEASLYYRDSDDEREIDAPSALFFTGGLNRLEEHFYGAALTLRQPRQTHTAWAVSLAYDVQVLDSAMLYSQLPMGGRAEEGFDLVGGRQSREIGSVVLEANSLLGAQEHWSLVYGGRLDHYSDFGTQASPRLGVIRALSDTSAVKLLYGQAFRAPTAAELYFQPLNNAGNIGNPDLEPEIMDSVELVYMAQKGPWQGSLVLFENRWRETISIEAVGPNLFAYVNGGRSRAHGLEAELAWRKGPWFVDANASYTKSRNDETGEDYELFPKVIGNLEIGYDWMAQSLSFSVINRMFADAKDAATFTGTTAQDLPTYYRMDLAVEKRLDSNIALFANVLNVFDRDNCLPSVFGVPNGIPDDPFSVSVGARVQF